MEYTPFTDTASVCDSSTTINLIEHNQPDRSAINYLCRLCKNRLFRKQQTDHITPVQCLGHRCESLENDIIQLKDHDIKSRLQMKELENKINALEDVIKGLTSPKDEQAAPFNFGPGTRRRHYLRRSTTEEVPVQKGNITYDNIIRRPRSISRERVGLFGSLGAASQQY
ncbi:unnamed protein product [Adineta steineri]|uniref:Uncharacterized protein n=1 Tax=Adineta steineri TaxID=433720 RepID=A0A818V6L3_9BILA|nr:unnamed protein product [Adineta steineri]CAF3710695.1 unnamed protein product [Adineta steineri]